MALSINWATRVITVPQADLTLLSGTTYELDIDVFRLALKDIEDNVDGMAFPDTHRHNTEVVLSGVTYARTVEIINNYKVMFEDTGTHYSVSCTGANHNLNDVTIYNGHMTLLPNNSAGLIVASGGGGGSTASDIWNYDIDGKTARNRLKTAERKAKIAAANS